MTNDWAIAAVAMNVGSLATADPSSSYDKTGLSWGTIVAEIAEASKVLAAAATERQKENPDLDAYLVVDAFAEILFAHYFQPDGSPIDLTVVSQLAIVAGE